MTVKQNRTAAGKQNRTATNNQQKVRSQHGKEGDVRSTLEYLFDSKEVFEVCMIAPSVRKHSLWQNEYANGEKPVIAGWFNNIDKAVEVITLLNEKVKPSGIYTTLNPCIPALLGRANNRFKAGVNRTKDSEIIEVRHMLVDADPVRPSGISSTDQEKEAALTLLRIVYQDLKEQGWPEPLVSDSGNGAHLIYPIENDVAELLPSILTALDLKYSTDAVKIDTAVGNPARLVKVYGTVTRKGDSTEERPHRRSKVLSLPGGEPCE